MGVIIKNNAVSTISTTISASDVGLAVATGTGSLFPTLGAGDYFYATLVSSGGTYEIVKVTARVGDVMTIVRAQEGTTAQSFASGTSIEARVTAASVLDVATEAASSKVATADLASTAAGKGASLVGVHDAGNYYAATTIEGVLQELGASGGTVGTNAIVDNFTGNGVTTSYTLSKAPISQNTLDVFINGVYQNKTDFSFAGTTLTFTQAPPLGAEIEVCVNTNALAGTVMASNVSYNQGGSGAVNRTAQAKLRDIISVKDFGAVGDGVTDDTAAIQAAIASIEAAFALNSTLMPSINYEIGQNLTQLVPVTLTGGAGIYKISQPITITRVKGLKIDSLNLIADTGFVGDYLVVVGDSGAYLGVENFIYQNSLLNANFVCGGIKFTDTARCLLTTTEILGFDTNGVYITGTPANYETQVVNCYIGVVPAGGTVPGGVVLDNTVSILIDNTDNVIRDNQLFKQGVGIKTTATAGNDIIQGNHIYSSSLYSMEVDSYPYVITGNYFDDLELYLKKPYFGVVTNNYFFANTNNAADKFIVLAPQQPNLFFQRLTISNNNFLNIGAAKCQGLSIDTSSGTLDYSNTRNVDMTGNTFQNVSFFGSKIRQSVSINLPAATTYTFDIANTQNFGYVGQIQYSYKQSTPDPFLPVGVGTVVTPVITGIGTSQAAIMFSQATTGTLYIDCDINTLPDNTI